MSLIQNQRVAVLRRQLRRTERHTELQLRHKSEISQTTAGEMTRRRAVRFVKC